MEAERASLKVAVIHRQHRLGFPPGVLVVGSLTIRALLFGIYVTVPDFWKLPCMLADINK